MKKWLILFVIVDFIFVGLVLKLSVGHQRQIASEDDKFYAELSEGQKNKFDFVKSLQFSLDLESENLVLKTDRLQALCVVATLIELKFRAVNVAYAGGAPTVSHTYSCNQIKRNTSVMDLKTSVKDFISLQRTKNLKLDDGQNSSELTSVLLYTDEDFPADWMLNEIVVSGDSNFTVTGPELAKVHGDQPFQFNLATFVK